MSKIHYIILVLIILTLVAGSFLLPKQQADSLKHTLRNRSGEVSSVPLKGIGKIQEGASFLSESVKSREELQKEVTTLRQENARLMTENARLRNFKAENARLREMVGFKQDSPFRLLAARVIARNPSTWRNIVTINRGTKDDPALRTNLPVVSPRGVIGKTTSVNTHTTQVLLLVDENCKISGTTGSSRARGIIMGDAAYNGANPLCKMTFISRESEFAVGEQIFTTGLGGTFPPNLLIGTVIEAPKLTQLRNFGLFKDAVIEPSVDLENLEEMFILLEGK